MNIPQSRATLKRILIVDDEPAIRSVIVAFLEGDDFVCLESESLQDAMEIIQKEKSLDAVILDFWLKDENALPVLKELRAIEPNLPIVVMSGGGSGASIEITHLLAAAVGEFRFLQKPFTKADLMEAIGYTKL